MGREEGIISPIGKGGGRGRGGMGGGGELTFISIVRGVSPVFSWTACQNLILRTQHCHTALIGQGSACRPSTGTQV
jgi:hypothetical protein